MTRQAPTYAVTVTRWLACALLLAASGGCRLTRPLDPASLWSGSPTATGSGSATTAMGSRSAAEITELLEQATRLEKREDPRCVDLYATAALAAYPAVQADAEGPELPQATKRYHQGLAGLLRTAVRHERFGPDWSIRLKSDEGWKQIKSSFHGNRWRADDYDTIKLACRFDRKELKRNWASVGLGVPLVAVRKSDPGETFLGERIPFSSTAVLQASFAGPESDDVIGTLEFHDPLSEDAVVVGSHPRPITRDLSAPLALAESEFNSDAIKNFLKPERVDNRAGLKMTEPYCPGKVPVIFVHGLVSDNFTWVNMYNDLRATPEFADRFQFWAFQYATGQSFLQSGSELRSGLQEVIAKYDPEGKDPALQHMVLVGHSMGGLVSKLQVTTSGTQLWDQYVSEPLAELELPEQNATNLSNNFFFEPNPSVRRVVFIGSPHKGSKWAHNFLARIGSNLVRMSSDRTELLKKLIKENPGVFHNSLKKGLPSSVDLLRKDSPLLGGMYDLPVSPRVNLHTIIGTGRPFLDGTPADGVVPVASARHPGTVSELMVDATHTELTGHPDSVAELRRILGVHLDEYDHQVRTKQSHEPVAKL
ncbi:MAG: hypothetical protein AAGF97_05940 [Planctomycetota bacterium]